MAAPLGRDAQRRRAVRGAMAAGSDSARCEQRFTAGRRRVCSRRGQHGDSRKRRHLLRSNPASRNLQRAAKRREQVQDGGAPARPGGRTGVAGRVTVVPTRRGRFDQQHQPGDRRRLQLAGRRPGRTRDRAGALGAGRLQLRPGPQDHHVAQCERADPDGGAGQVAWRAEPWPTESALG